MKCKYCGAENSDDSIFCSECGKNLRESLPEKQSTHQEDSWYYAEGENYKGPFSALEIKSLFDAGQIQLTTYVWKDGLTDWVTYQESELYTAPNQTMVTNTADETVVDTADWYYYKDDEVIGPCNEQALVELYLKGVINQDTYICQQGNEDWMFFKDSRFKNVVSQKDKDSNDAPKVTQKQEISANPITSSSAETKQKKDLKINLVLVAVAAVLLVAVIFGVKAVSSDSSANSQNNEEEVDFSEVEQTYTYIYTDGVEGETVFEDKVYTDISQYDDQPSFTPTRDGYTFMRWDQKEDPDDPYTIIFTAVWEKEVDPEAGIYVTNYVMSIRTGPNRTTTELREIPPGSTVNIIEVDHNSDGTWGKISDNEWICLSDTQYIYCTKQ